MSAAFARQTVDHTPAPAARQPSRLARRLELVGGTGAPAVAGGRPGATARGGRQGRTVRQAAATPAPDHTSNFAGEADDVSADN